VSKIDSTQKIIKNCFRVHKITKSQKVNKNQHSLTGLLTQVVLGMIEHVLIPMVHDSIPTEGKNSNSEVDVGITYVGGDGAVTSHICHQRLKPSSFKFAGAKIKQIYLQSLKSYFKLE
jgi:hypothetical protein